MPYEQMKEYHSRGIKESVNILMAMHCGPMLRGLRNESVNERDDMPITRDTVWLSDLKQGKEKMSCHVVPHRKILPVYFAKRDYKGVGCIWLRIVGRKKSGRKHDTSAVWDCAGDV